MTHSVSKSYIRKVALATAAELLSSDGLPQWPIKQGYVDMSTGLQMAVISELMRIGHSLQPKRMPKPKFAKGPIE